MIYRVKAAIPELDQLIEGMGTIAHIIRCGFHRSRIDRKRDIGLVARTVARLEGRSGRHHIQGILILIKTDIP